jgi:hypothetical protein
LRPSYQTCLPQEWQGQGPNTMVMSRCLSRYVLVAVSRCSAPDHAHTASHSVTDLNGVQEVEGSNPFAPTIFHSGTGR